MLLKKRGEQRDGLSLLEVILSLAVFMASIAALYHLVQVSTDWAVDAKHRTQAALYAQSKLAEARIGAITLTGQSESQLDDDPDYMWSMDVQAGPYDGLKNVRIKVWREIPGGQRIETSLVQVVLDPAFMGSSQDGSGTNSQSETESGTSSSSSASSSSTPSSGAAAAPAPAATGTPLGGGTGGTGGKGGATGGMGGKGGSTGGKGGSTGGKG